MVDLIELLFNQHYENKRIFISWDAASWHDSIEVHDWVDRSNRLTDIERQGPLIEIVPLPSSAQFLDVIESVFGSMKCAVIHNSDYRSTIQMKEAVSRHFAERNAHFMKNPRRAGKKIWDIDFFSDFGNLRSGDYREW